MYLGVRCCLVTLIATALVSTQVAALDENPIPRISVASGSSTGDPPVPGTPAQGANSSGSSPPNAAPVSPDVKPNPLPVSGTSSDAGRTGSGSDGGGQPPGADQAGQDKTTAAQKTNESSESKTVPAFSITEVTKPEPSQPQNPAGEIQTGSTNKKDTIPRINVSVTKNTNPADNHKPEDPTPETVSNAGTGKPEEKDKTEKAKEQVGGSSSTTSNGSPSPVQPSTSSTGTDVAKDLIHDEAKGVVAPTITEIIQPVAGVLSDSSTVEAKNTDHAGATDGMKDPVPKINVSVTSMIQPVAGAKQENVAKEGDGTRQGATGGETKVDRPLTSSGLSEGSEQQPPESSVQKTTPEGDKDVAKRSAPDQSPSQSLTSLITPVQSMQTEKGATSKTNPTTMSKENVDAKTSSDKKPNAYTITANEFAKKTADVHAQKPEEENSVSGDKTVDNVPENGRNPKPENGKTLTNMPNTNPQSTPAQEEGPKSDVKSSADSLTDLKNNGDKHETNTENSPGENIEGTPLKSSDRNENFNHMGFLEQAESLITEFKSFNEYLDEKWNERKRKTSWLGGAFGELHRYHEIIIETKGYSVCPSSDLTKYNEKMKNLDEIINECESTARKTNPLELQDKINKLIGDIQSVKTYFNDDKISISKENKQSEERLLSLEKEAKNKLQNINTNTVRDELTELKNKTLKAYENDYTNCIDKQDTKSRGSNIVSETMQSIMDIYTCVQSKPLSQPNDL